MRSGLEEEEGKVIERERERVRTAGEGGEKVMDSG